MSAGPLSQWLVSGLTEADLPVVCVETRHMKALLKAQQVNKSDRNDARGIAQMMRVGLFKPVHVKTLVSQEQRMLLTSRKLVQRKLMDIECDMRGTLRNFGPKVGVVSSIGYEARIRNLVEGFPRLAAIMEPLLTVRRVMREQLATLHKLLLNAVRVDPVCRRFMTVPGVGPIVALTRKPTSPAPKHPNPQNAPSLRSFSDPRGQADPDPIIVCEGLHAHRGDDQAQPPRYTIFQRPLSRKRSFRLRPILLK